MRPQPGQAVTCGVKLRMPSDCRICCADADFFGAVAAGRGGERDADGVADAFLQDHGQSSGGGDDAFGAHAGFGEAEMQRVVAARGERAIDVDEVLHAADFGAEDDLVATQAVLFGERRRVQRAHDHCFHGDFAGVFGLGKQGVLVHHAGEQGADRASPSSRRCAPASDF